MRPLPKENQNNKGQILINLLVAIALFAILSHALFTLVSASYSIVSFTKARITARHLTLEKIEIIRNLAYDDIGTIGGIPPGTIEQTESITRNGLNYTINTSVLYIDDPFDGLAPIDLLPTDYKRIRVDTSWEGLSSSSKNPVTYITDVAPSGIETTEGGGTLSILVFDANALPVGQATVTIFSDETDPQVDMTLETSDNGRVILPGAPTCKKPCYQVTVTKDGYSTDRTYSTDEVANPNKPYLLVLESELTEMSFAIDNLSTLNISSFESVLDSFVSLPNIDFSIRGDKTIGTDSKDNPVYKYSDSFQTDGSGFLSLNNLEWDNYQIWLDPASGWDIAGTNPLSPLTMAPDTEIDFSFTCYSHSENSLLAGFADTSSSPIASVSAQLFDGEDLIATGSSGISGNPNFGQVFFSDLESQFYDLVATVSGYVNFEGSVDVSGYSIEKVILSEE